jgi:hypothetical protein
MSDEKYEIIFYDTSGTRVIEYSNATWEEVVKEVEERQVFIDIYGRACYFFIRRLSDRTKRTVIYLYEDIEKIYIYFSKKKPFKTSGGFVFK